MKYLVANEITITTIKKGNLPECQKDNRAYHRSRATWSSRLG